jgi:hypothetical protein
MPDTGWRTHRPALGLDDLKLFTGEPSLFRTFITLSIPYLAEFFGKVNQDAAHHYTIRPLKTKTDVLRYLQSSGLDQSYYDYTKEKRLAHGWQA